ncbi:MAG: restriction endonuclease [Nitrososphaerota archaeon]|nr:restriction endonuclease [Nitrososphaerota archaeon]MDG6977908.1 restriction endonuclease [Nitrososphaerota archaeon]MDG7021606.1 restriction endonuclease [Nitrososphaerota archaeon]
MGRRRRPLPTGGVRRIDVPVPDAQASSSVVLESILGKERALLAAEEVARELGLAPGAPRNVSSALALTKMGRDPGSVAASLSWGEFEEYCAMVIAAAGYSVTRNVRLRKPTRQIDIVAESPSLVLSVDCKHWRRTAGPAGLEALALAQEERTRAYAGRARPGGAPCLPVLLTMLDNQVRVVAGVPVVPLQALRGFLSSVSRFDEGLSLVSAG